jgi:hypothetical protein
MLIATLLADLLVVITAVSLPSYIAVIMLDYKRATLPLQASCNTSCNTSSSSLNTKLKSRVIS